jgi:hypothetical protein
MAVGARHARDTDRHPYAADDNPVVQVQVPQRAEVNPARVIATSSVP